MAQDLGGKVERAARRVRQDVVPRDRRARRRPPRGADGLDEPPRLRHRAARGRDRHRRLRGDADRRLRGAGARPLRRPVPPRGRAHPARPGGAEELPLRRRRRAPDVDARGGDRGAGRAHPRPGRQGARPLCALGRGRLRGGGAPRPQGGRRPAHLRLRRPRADAQGRVGPGRRDVRGPLPRPARARRRRRPLPRPARGRHRARGEAPHHRRGVHPRLRGGGGQDRRNAASSSRGRSTPT